MPETGRSNWVVQAARGATIGTLALMGLAVVFTAILCVYLFLENPNWIVPFAGVLAILAELTTALCAFVFYGVVRAMVANESQLSATAGRVERLETLLEDQNAATRRIADLASLSDKAKSLIYHDREIDALRETVHEHLIGQDYGSAEALVASVADMYPDEAARLRQEITDSRKATHDDKVNLALDRVEHIIQSQDFARALREAQRVMQAFPGDQRVLALPTRIQSERNRHKRELLQAYGEAVSKNDIDHSIELIRELDRYLSPQEAAALQDSARGIFRAKLHNLGVQFAIQATEQRWEEAIGTGEQIVRDYPNSRMAYEVRSKMDSLRTRAAEVRQAKGRA